MISRLPYGIGAGLMGASTYMSNFESEMFERGLDDDVTRGDIVKNSMIKGGADMIMEYAGGRMINTLAKGGAKKELAEKTSAEEMEKAKKAIEEAEKAAAESKKLAEELRLVAEECKRLE